MYNNTQLAYIIVSLVLTVTILIGSAFIKNEKWKDRFLKFWAVATFILHISVMWVNYLNDGHAEAPLSVLFAIYFCNACMYVLMITAFIRNKQSKLFRYLATFVAYGGFFGALITLFECHYLEAPDAILKWGNLKSMLSHSTMLVGCLYLFVGGFVKIRVKNLIPFSAGLIGCLFLGLFNNWLFVSKGLENPNSMYLVRTALDGVPLLTGYFIAAAMVVLIFVFTVIWEQFAVRKGERWYNNLAHFLKRKSQSNKV